MRVQAPETGGPSRARRATGAVLGVFFLAGAVGHAVAPWVTAGLVPAFVPQWFAHAAATVTELAVGVGVFVPRWRDWALWGIIALLLAFLPLHVVDALRDAPAIGPPAVAYLRVPLQLVLVALAWFSLERAVPGGRVP
jgi:uncharacterized membrane protein